MATRWLASVVMVFLFATALQAQSRQIVSEKLQAAPALQGWRLSGEPLNYDASTIDSFSRAPVPLLKLYGTKGAHLLEWNTPQGRVRLSLFEMVDPPAAYGVFTSLRPAGANATPVLIGAGSFRDGYLCFWQANYAVRIEGPSNLQDELASLVSEYILGDSWKPVVTEHLPPAHLIAGSEKYHLVADNVPPIRGLESDQLGFENSVEAASAQYNVSGVRARLLLLHYPTQHIARKYEGALNTAGAPGFRKRDGPLLAIVYDTTDEAVARSILDGVDLEYSVVYDETDPVVTYAQMMVGVFKFIGFAVMFAVGAGVAFGGFRILIKKLFPDRVFDRQQDVEIIQLKLDEPLTRKELGE